MNIFARISMILSLPVLISVSGSCTAAEISTKPGGITASAGSCTIYIINNGIHTGIVIPVESESLRIISALKYFKEFSFADIGWGEETAYQDTEDRYLDYIKAVLYPNPSVICIEGYRAIGDSFIGWSDFTVMLSLTPEQYERLLNFIEQSLKKVSGGEVIITSKRHLGSTIFFRSVQKYHMFNTCNTWVASALQSSGLDVSPSFVITARHLYSGIKNLGIVLKPLK